MTAETLEIEGYEVRVTNPGKVLYPATGFTKRMLVDYYLAVAHALLPHVEGRPLTLKRFPDGVDGEFFYEKQCPSYRPDWLPVVDVPSERSGTIRYCTVGGPAARAALAWLANAANIELHPLLARAPAIDRPTQVVFDLDPGPPAGIVDAARVALILRDALADVGLDTFAKSSGSKGVHVMVPLDGTNTYDDTKPFARALAQLLERHWPEVVVSSMRKDRRAGRVLVDWSQNDEHKSTVAPYSLRARAHPHVAAPLTWDEVAVAAGDGDASALLLDWAAVVERVERLGDLHAPAVGASQRLPSAGTGGGAGDRLERYRAMRRFDATPEPAGGEDARPAPSAAAAAPAERRRFVIQEHHATRLHWDLRLEHDGALPSWALPRGVPWSPGDNRLAVHTEDHPLEYLEFHGEIPEGEYGAGRMTVWDRGTYEAEIFEENKVQVVLHGERVQGRYALFPIGDRDWMIHRMDPPADPTRRPVPADLRPMRAVAGPLPADDDGWAFEIRWRGERVLVTSSGGSAEVRTAGGRDVGDLVPEVKRVGRAVGAVEVVLDGVLVAVDAGRPLASADAVARRLEADDDRAARRLARRHPLAVVLFDLLWLEGHAVTDRPYTERRSLLDELALEGPAWLVPAAHAGDGEPLLDAARQQGLWGLVAKRLDSPYAPGAGPGTWVEVRA